MALSIYIYLVIIEIFPHANINCASIMESQPPHQFVPPKDFNGLTNGEDRAARLKDAAPDIYHEESLFTPRSKAQEDANIGLDRDTTSIRSIGAWGMTAKEMEPRPPPPEVPQVAQTNKFLLEMTGGVTPSGCCP